MQSINFEVKGTSPLMFAAEPPYEERDDTKHSPKQDKNTKPVEIATQQLHTIPNGSNGKRICVLPAHNLLRSIQGAITFLPKTRSISKVKVVRGGVFIEPLHLVLKPQDWTIDCRRTGNGMRAGGSPLRYRPRFDAWAVDGEVKYDERHLDENELRSLFDYAGSYIGVGSWRPERGGPYGRFIVTRWEA